MNKKNLHVPFLFALFLVLVASIPSTAQVAWGCNDPDGGIQIWFDYNQNCQSSPGSLAGLSEIGFHSGANGWASVIEWDHANATNGMNMGNDTFAVFLPDPNTYYGITVTAINFVFNQGPINAGEPWGAEGKEDDGNGGCADFYVDLLNIAETCATTSGVEDFLLDKHLTISPNPFSDFTTISFDNEDQDIYNIQVRNSMGQIVKEVIQFTGDEIKFDRQQHPSGIYFLTLINEKGQFYSSQLIVR